MQLSIRFREVAAKARKFILNHSLNAGVFDDIQVHGSNIEMVIATNALREFAPFNGGRMQGVGYFVTYEHIVNRSGHVFPYGQAQNAVFRIERGGFLRIVVNDSNILGRHKTRKNILRSGSDGSCRGDLHTHIIPWHGEHSRKNHEIGENSQNSY